MQLEIKLITVRYCYKNSYHNIRYKKKYVHDTSLTFAVQWLLLRKKFSVVFRYPSLIYTDFTNILLVVVRWGWAAVVFKVVLFNPALVDANTSDIVLLIIGTGRSKVLDVVFFDPAFIDPNVANVMVRNYTTTKSYLKR